MRLYRQSQEHQASDGDWGHMRRYSWVTEACNICAQTKRERGGEGPTWENKHHWDDRGNGEWLCSVRGPNIWPSCPPHNWRDKDADWRQRGHERWRCDLWARAWVYSLPYPIFWLFDLQHRWRTIGFLVRKLLTSPSRGDQKWHGAVSTEDESQAWQNGPRDGQWEI